MIVFFFSDLLHPSNRSLTNPSQLVLECAIFIAPTEQLSNMAPRIVDYKHLIVAKQGETILLPCIAQGSPTPQIIWSRWTGIDSTNGVSFDPMVAANVQDQASISSSIGNIFDLPIATLVGTTSTINSGGGATSSGNMVNPNPLSPLLSSLNVTSVSFPSQSSSSGAVNNKPNLPTDSMLSRYYILNENSLLIKQVQLTDAGKYRCLANNSLGTQFVETQLIVTGE